MTDSILLTKKYFPQFVVLSALVAMAYAAPQFQYQQQQYQPGQVIPIVKQQQEVNFDGSYQWR